MTIRRLLLDETQSLITFVARRNVPGGQLCLHLADRPEDVPADFAELEPLTDCCLVDVVPETGVWRGVVAWDAGGGDGDGPPQRAWLFGPWSATEDLDEHVTLLRAALEHMPRTVRRVDNFVDLAFSTGLAAHARLGFDPRRTVHIMRAMRHRPVPSPLPIEAVRDPTDDDRACLAALHDAAFPETHTGLDGMLAAGDGRLWCARDEGIVGYVHATRAESQGQGCIEYVAVRADRRGRGIGRALLSTALAWLFDCGMAEVFLTVDADNDTALGVYRAAGFEDYRAGRALTLRRSAPSARAPGDGRRT